MNKKKYLFLFIYLNIIIIISSAVCLAEEYSDMYRKPEGDISIEANHLEYYKDRYKATDDVKLDYDFYHIEADKLDYTSFESFSANKIKMTTCPNHEKPHFCVIAEQISTSKKNDIYKIKFKKVKFKIKDTTILSLPQFTYQVNANNQAAYLAIITPGYNSTEGFFLSYAPQLFQTERHYLDTNIRYSTKEHLAYDAYFNYGFDGVLSKNPYKTMKVSDMISSVTNLEKSFVEKGLYNGSFNKTSQLYGSLGVTYKKRETTMDGTTVNIYKTPEIKLTWNFMPIGKTKGFDQRVLLNPVISASWAREKDPPLINEYLSKFTSELEVPYCLGEWNGIYFQPMTKLAYNKYEDKSTYKAIALGLDMSKYFNDNSFWNLRYIWADENGETPFEFDSIKYEQGIMGAFQKQFKRYIFGAWGAYNINEDLFYRYGVTIGYKTDCINSAVSYDFHEKKLLLSIGVLGF